MHSNISFSKNFMGFNYVPDTVVRPQGAGGEQESQGLLFLGV